MTTRTLVLSSESDVTKNPFQNRIGSRGVEVSCVRLLAVHIPNTFYNVVVGKNKFRILGTTYTVDPGAYTVDDLVNTMNTVALATRFVYYPTINRISNTIAVDFSIPDSMGEIVGFGLNNILTVQNAANEPRIMPKSLSVIIKELKTSQNLNIGNLHQYEKGFVVPIDVNMYEMITLSDALTQQMAISYGGKPFFLDNCTVSLVNNETGKLVEMKDDWSVTLEIKTK